MQWLYTAVESCGIEENRREWNRSEAKRIEWKGHRARLRQRVAEVHGNEYARTYENLRYEKGKDRTRVCHVSFSVTKFKPAYSGPAAPAMSTSRPLSTLLLLQSVDTLYLSILFHFLDNL